jgi:hypothetical protein
MTKSEQIQADARAAAETEMAKQCAVANIVVGQPTLVGAAPQTFKTNVRVACDDGHEHCFEWRCQTDGTLGTLWPVACPLPFAWRRPLVRIRRAASCISN